MGETKKIFMKTFFMSFLVLWTFLTSRGCQVRPPQPLVKICQPDNCVIGKEGVRRQLLVDVYRDGTYQPFLIKGIAYNPTPVGKFYAYGEGWSALCAYAGPPELASSEKRYEVSTKELNHFICSESHVYEDKDILDRDFKLIQAMRANTIRTWAKVTPQLLKKANQYDLKVIAGFWVNHHMDFLTDDPEPIIQEFLDYIEKYKDDPAILMWGLSNENNINFCTFKGAGRKGCDTKEQARAFFALINRMAKKAKAIYPRLQPMILVTAEMLEMEDSLGILRDIDVFGINSYRGRNFGDLFSRFEHLVPDKPMLITEFGFDAYDTLQNKEEQGGQMEFTLEAWHDIVANDISKGKPNLGGVVFTYSDSWDIYLPKYDFPYIPSSQWTPSVAYHDTGYLLLRDGKVWDAGQPDWHYSPEWAGIMAIKSDPKGGIDKMVPRKLYYALQEEWK